MPGCNGPDRGSRFALTRKSADFREVWLALASIRGSMQGSLEETALGQFSALVPAMG